ncbi:MAG TPA: ATP-binding protein [Acidimicrobiales bacterium]|nr:ATP-binding protein [Acidimicrobiales bacterium]
MIIDRLNARYGTDWSDADRLVFDAALDDLVANEDVQVTAVNNTTENFGVVFPELFQKALLGRMDRNEKVVFKFLDHSDLAADVVKVYATLAQARARVAYQEHCPIGELLSVGAESAHLEYKSTLRTGADTGEVYKPLETASIKTIAAFANSTEGGTLLIGIADDGSLHGLASDYASLRKPGKADRDRFQLHFNQLLVNAFGETAASTVSTQSIPLTAPTSAASTSRPVPSPSTPPWWSTRPASS